jgi:hypothetical protein
MDNFNSEVVADTLRKVVEILESNHIKYLFLGSVVVAAINGKPHRKLGDLDLIIDSSGKDTLYDELMRMGYTRAGGMFSFARKYLSLETLDSSTLLGVGYFHGNFKKDGSFMMGNNKINVTIAPVALKETAYTLLGIKFIGIPENVAAVGVLTSKTNPKRKKEVALLTDKNIKPLQNNYIHVNIFGMKADWIYHLSMGLLNLIGSIRVKLGLAFDPWR